MCRSIKVLRRRAGDPEPPATTEEVSAAALQFVRKISGFPKPSKLHQQAFEQAVRDVTAASTRLLRTIEEAKKEPSSPAPASNEACVP